MTNSGYASMKNFHDIYRKEGAYHHRARGFESWFLHDNYFSIGSQARKDDVVVDIACGEGCLGSYLNVTRLVGIDYSGDALRLCRQLNPNKYDELHVGDMRFMEEVGLAKASFTLAVCSISLMYLIADDLDRCLRDIASLLSPLGRFVFTYPTIGQHRQGSREAAELPRNELIARLLKAGFVVTKMIPICPFVSKDIVERSHLAESQNTAFADYELAKAQMSLENSYHFLCMAVKR